LSLARETALEAGRVIMEVYRSGAFGQTLKPDESPLTQADSLSHSTISRLLGKTGLPVLSEEGKDIEYRIRKDWTLFWLIDPLDGTKEFIARNGEFTVNIALVQSNIAIAGVVYAPALDRLYAGSRELGVYRTEKGNSTRLAPLAERCNYHELLQKEGLRVIASRSHLSEDTSKFIARLRNCTLVRAGSALKFMSLVEDQADLYPRFSPTMEWDTAAAHAILNASGRSICGADGQNELLYNKPSLVNPWFIAF
ncbi:MAG: 3'(2'),5'-bisphosphate nucleotidase CysQ, partial [Bacteroidota bacterium]|nr:3'(2'),5'-bisphosphate nucleotidase CysQ [Bacteroidota bacterium]